MHWPKTVKIYWDPEKNIPLIKPPPGDEEFVFRLRLTEPGDARPAIFRDDISRLREGIIYEFGDDTIYRRYFEGRFILFNKVPHWDQMWEIIASGNVLGQLYYDPFRDTWRFRLTSTGAYIAYMDGLVDAIVVDDRLRRGMLISRDTGSSRQLVVLDRKMRVRGLGERRGDGVAITRIFKRVILPVETSDKPATIHDVIKHNEYGIYYYSSRSKAFLYSMASKTNKPVVVSYSGGKDSLVSLHLALDSGLEPVLLFNDTGIELPETKENVEYVASKYGLRKVVASAGNAFWIGLESFGPPGKDYRWCCKVTKLVPLARTARREWPLGALNIVGQRAYESIDRARSPRVWRNRWIPHLLSISPIQEWGQLHVWLYIYYNRLPYNPLYDMGFERLGCYLCPSSTLAEFKVLSKTHPDLWGRWIAELEKWRKRLDQPPEWIKYGLWRWLTPSQAKKRITRHIPGYTSDWREEYRRRLLYSSHGLAPLEINIAGNKERAEIEFSKNLVSDEQWPIFAANIRMLGMNIQRYNTNIINIIGTHIHAHIESNRIKYTCTNKASTDQCFEEFADILKILYRMHGCVKCASCVIWCPYRLIQLTRHGPVPRAPCPHTHICIDVCPIAEVLVERVVIPLILNDPGAWKRKSRPHREEVLERLKENIVFTNTSG